MAATPKPVRKLVKEGTKLHRTASEGRPGAKKRVKEAEEIRKSQYKKHFGKSKEETGKFLHKAEQSRISAMKKMPKG